MKILSNKCKFGGCCGLLIFLIGLYIVISVLMAICSLLLHPHPDNPAHQEAANMYLSDPEKFKQTAEEWTKLHAPLDV